MKKYTAENTSEYTPILAMAVENDFAPEYIQFLDSEIRAYEIIRDELVSEKERYTRLEETLGRDLSYIEILEKQVALLQKTCDVLQGLLESKQNISSKERKLMNEKDFVKLCKKTVAEYANAHLDKSDGKQITEDDVFIVWMCKTLQNSKALASTTLFDGMYYELTFNGDKGELYVDAYKKWENLLVVV